MMLPLCVDIIGHSEFVSRLTIKKNVLLAVGSECAL